MRWLYFIKLLLRLPLLRKGVASPLLSLWRILRGNDQHTLRLAEGRLLERRITAPNLYGFILLRAGGVPLAETQPDDPDQLLWQLSPVGTFLTRLTIGMDLMTLYELFVRKDYGEHFAGKVVVDVGAYNGDSAVFFALQGAAQVIALEPYPPSYALAQQNIQRMKLTDRITLLPYALGAQYGKLHFQVAPASPDANSLLPPNTPLQRLIRYETTTEVEVLTLPELMSRMGLSEIDFLKLDCEGCEFAVIQALSPQELRQVKTWHIEYHDQPASLAEKLRQAGFVVRKEKDRGILGYLIAERI